MSVVFFTYIDSDGKKGCKRIYAEDNEETFDFLDRVKEYFILLTSNGFHILRVEVT